MSIRFGRIEGGHDGDPDPQQGGRVRVRDIARHGQLVKTKDLPFSQLLSPASENGAYSFNRPPLPGTLVVYWQPEGAESTGYAFPIGIPHGIDEGNQPIPGNTTIPNIGAAFETMMKIAPNLESVLGENRKGIEKLQKQFQERSTVSYQNLIGTNTHGAPFIAAGIHNTPLQNIATALENYTQILNKDMLSSLPTQSFSLGNLFSLFSEQEMNDLFKVLPQEISVGLTNILLQMQQDSSLTPSSGASLGGQINPLFFVPQALSLLKNVGTFGELISALQQLNDGSLSGLDQLGSIENKIMTPFGEMIQLISPLGTIENQLTDELKAAIGLFQGLVSGIPGIKDTNLLTQNGTAFSTLIERLNDPNTVSLLKSKLEQFSPTINQTFAKMEDAISDVNNGQLTVAGITFGNTVKHN